MGLGLGLGLGLGHQSGFKHPGYHGIISKINQNGNVQVFVEQPHAVLATTRRGPTVDLVIIVAAVAGTGNAELEADEVERGAAAQFAPQPPGQLGRQRLCLQPPNTRQNREQQQQQQQQQLHQQRQQRQRRRRQQRRRRRRHASTTLDRIVSTASARACTPKPIAMSAHCGIASHQPS